MPQLDAWHLVFQTPPFLVPGTSKLVPANYGARHLVLAYGARHLVLVRGSEPDVHEDKQLTLRERTQVV